MNQEITAAELNAPRFIDEKVAEIKAAVGTGTAINALSGGVDSSTVTMLGHHALGKQLRTVFIENGLMREGEAARVVDLFNRAGVKVEVVDAQEEFFLALRGITDPEEKREAITQTFYKKVFGRLVRESGSKHLLQGTILTDIDETVAGHQAAAQRLRAARHRSAAGLWLPHPRTARPVAQGRRATGGQGPRVAGRSL